MAEPKKRNLRDLYDGLKKISQEENVDFGIDNYTYDQFKDKYGSKNNLSLLWKNLSDISEESNLDFGIGTSDEWLNSFSYDGASRVIDNQPTEQKNTAQPKSVGYNPATFAPMAPQAPMAGAANVRAPFSNEVAQMNYEHQRAAAKPKQQPQETAQPLGPERFKKQIEMQQATGKMQADFNKRLDDLRNNYNPFTTPRPEGYDETPEGKAYKEYVRRADARDRVWGERHLRMQGYNKDFSTAAGKAWDIATEQSGKEQMENIKASSRFSFVPGTGGMLMLQNKAAHLKNHDIELMTNNAWQALGKEKQDAIIEDYYQQLVSEQARNAGKGDGEGTMSREEADRILREQAEQIAKARQWQAMYDKAVEMNAPKDVLDFMGRKIVEGNTISKLVAGAARVMAGTRGDMEARDVAMQNYEREGHKGYGIAADVLQIATDPVTYVSGGTGGAVTKALAKGVEKKVAAETLKRGGQTLATRVLEQAPRVAGGAINFALFESLGNAGEQARMGGVYDPETGEYTYDMNEIGKAAGHGLLLGGAGAIAGGLIGNVGNKVYKNVSSTGGKLAVRGAEAITNDLAMGTIFAAPELISGEGDFDTWLDNVEMMAAFRLSHGVKPSTIGQRFEQLRKNPESRAGFETRLRTMLDRQPGLALTSDEAKELNDAGYNDLKQLVEAYKSTDGKMAVRGEEMPYNRFEELMNDKNISKAAKAKMYYYVTGKLLPQPTVVEVIPITNHDADGKVKDYTVETKNEKGEVITRHSFKSKNEAEVEFKRMARQVEMNKIELLEQMFDQVSDDNTTSKMLRDVIGKENGVDIDKAIGKEPNRRSDKEQAAIDEYTKAMLEGAYGAWSRAGRDIGRKMIEGPYRDGYEADEQQRSDIAIEAAEGKEGAEEAWRGVQQRINDDADMMAAEQREEAKKRQYKDGSIHPATLKETDADGNPKEVFVVDGDVTIDDEGNISGGENIVVYDPLEGKNRFLSPSEIAELGEVTTAEQTEQNIEANKQAYLQQQMDAATGRFNPQPGQLIDMPDGNNAVVLAVDNENKNVTLQMPDNTQQTMSIADIQQIADDMAMEDYRQRHPEAQQVEAPEQPVAEQPKGAPETFEPMMELTIKDEDGNEQQAVVTGGRARFTGKGYTDDPNGKFVELYVAGSEEPRYIHEDELKKMVTDYTVAELPAEEVETPTEEQVEAPVAEQAEEPTAKPQPEPEPEPEAEVDPMEAPMPMKTVGKDKHEEEDWMATTPERAYKYLYEEAVELGLPIKTVDNIVANNLKKAQDGVKRAETATGSIVGVLQKQKAAQEVVDYWKQVQNLRNQQLLAEAEARNEATRAERERRQKEIDEARKREQEAYEAELARRKAEKEKKIEASLNSMMQMREESEPMEQMAKEWPIEQDAEAMEIMNDLSPRTLEEVAARMLSDTKDTENKIDPELIREHTGYSTTDFKKFPFIFKKGGMSPEAFGEKIEQIARENDVPFDETDTNIGFNALLNVLGEVGGLGDLKNYIKENRRAEAEKLHSDRLREAVARQAEDDWVAQHGGMTREEYASYINWMEDAVEQGKTALTDEEYNQLFNTDHDRTTETNDERGEQRGVEESRADESEAGQAGVAADDTRRDGEEAAEQPAGEVEDYRHQAEKAVADILEGVERGGNGPVVSAEMTDAIQKIADINADAEKRLDAGVEDAQEYKRLKAIYDVTEDWLDNNVREEEKDLPILKNISTFASENNNQLSLFGEYETTDGEKLGYVSLLGQGDERADANADRRPAGGDITGYSLRKLEPGETCNVERRYQETNQFNFTGREKIESYDDVAYIFKQLQDAAVENAFIVLVKDGKPTVVHVGMGKYTDTPFSIGQALVAYRNINPDAVYMVHNHPSGAIRPSKADVETLTAMRKFFGNKLQDGIIIDTTSGKYGIFNEKNVYDGAMPDEANGKVPVKVYQFSKQVFAKDWNPETAYDFIGEKNIAAFISSHRLGEHQKMSLILINNQGKLIGNIFLPYIDLTKGNKQNIIDDIAYYGNQMAAKRAILYGNFGYNDKSLVKSIAKGLQYSEITLVDAVLTDSYGNLNRLGVSETNVGDNILNDGDVKQQKTNGNATKTSGRDRGLLEVVMDKLRNIIGDRLHTTLTEDEKRLINWARAAYHRVFHGSGADFERFDSSHMGEGEGNQSYGYGHYTTEVEGIGRTYAHAAGGRHVEYKGEKPPTGYAGEIISVMKDEMENGGKTFNYSIKKTLDFLKQNPEENKKEIAFFENMKESDFDIQDNPKVLYTVEIPDDNGNNYLVWNKKASDKQVERIKQALLADEKFQQHSREQYEYTKSNISDASELPPFEEWMNDHAGVIAMSAKESGERVYQNISNAFGSDKAASEFLHNIGFTGIKYPAEYMSGGRSDGAKNYVIFDDGDLKITDKIKFFKTPQGEVYGFTVGGNIYVDMDIAKADTPIHEYGHLWVPMVRESDPEMWEDIKRVLTKDKDVKPFMDIVRQRYPELSAEGREDDFMEEVLAHFSGAKGLERLEEAAREYEEQDGNGIISKAKAMAVLNKVKSALEKFWGKVAELFGIKFRNAQEIADKVLNDLLHGVDPTAVRSEREETNDKKYMEAVEKGDVEAEQKMVAEAAKEAMPDTKVVDENGMPMVVYHGAYDGGYTVFDKSKRGTATNAKSATKGFFFTDSKKWGEEWARRSANGELYEVYLNMRNPLVVDFEGKSVNADAELNKLINQAKREGYDGVIAKNLKDGFEVHNQYVAFEPEQIKSADPVTYDNAGNVIPLSKRFNSRNADIRYQKLGGVQTDNKTLFDTAKRLFGTTNDLREAGYILPDGTMLDFSGRHLLDEGKDDSFLRGRRTTDHREISSIEYEKDGWTETGLKTDMSDFIRRGAIRIDNNAGAINLAVKPTKEQRDTLRRLIDRNDGTVQVDFGDGWNSDHYAEYDEAKSMRVLNDIDRYFDEGVKPDGNATLFRSLDPESDNVVDNAEVGTRPLSDREKVAKLEAEPKVKVYRSMQLIDGKLYPPMSAKVDGKLREPSELGVWEEADENPDLADENGKFKLDKGNRKSLKAAYNPYIHTSRTMLNDQFSEAQDRPNLVVVEMEVPESELTSDYKAEKAKDSVGVKQWKAGVIQGQLNGTREVILSRWAKPVRIVPVEEVAENIAKQIEGQVDVMPSNVVTPDVRAALEAKDVKFVETDNTGKIKDGPNKGKTWTSVYGKKQIELDNAKRDAVNRLSKKFNVDIEVVENIEDIKHNDPKEHERMRKASGFYRLGSGKLVVVLPNNRDVKDTVATVMHEVVTHKGLREIIGDDNMPAFLDEMYSHLSDELKQRVGSKMTQEFIDDMRGGIDKARRVATEEMIADISEKMPEDMTEQERSLWQKICDWVRGIIDKFMKEFHLPNDYKVTEDDIRYMILKSRENMESRQRESTPKAEVDSMNEEILRRDGEPTEPATFNAPAKEQGEDMVSYAKRVADAYRVYQEGVPKIAAREAYERSMGYGANQFKEAVQDSMLSLKELYRAILGKDAKIEEVKGYENAYLAENRMHSASEAQVHAYQKDFIVPIVDAIYDLIGRGKFNKEKYDDLVDYMMAKHGLERNRVFAERDAQAAAKKGADYDEELQKNQGRDYAGLTALTGESDVTNAEGVAQKMVDDYEANHDTTALWENINRATKQSLYTLYSSGMMTKERYDQIMDMFDYYIPLQGFDSTIAEDVYAYLGSDGTLGYGTPIRSARGRVSKADDPIATIAMNGEAAIRQANRNEMKKNFLNFVQNHPSDLVSVSDVWLKYNDVTGEWEQVTADLQEGDIPDDVERKTKAFDEKMEQLSKNDPDHYKKASDMPNVPYRVVQSGNMKQHQVTVKRNGKDYVLTINGNPRAAQALNGLTNPDVFTEGVFGKAMNLGQWLNRQLSAFYTTRNPEFVLSNFLRDAIYSNAMVGTKEDGKYAMQFHKNFGKMNPVSMGKLFAAWENGSLRDKVRNGTCTETERMFYDFMMNGGETGWTNMRDIEKHKKEIQSALKMEGSTNRKAWKALGSAFDLMNRSVENCARFAAFVTSREMGRSLERSIWDAKEISVNFNKKGAGDKFLTANNQKILGQIGAALGGLGRGLYVFWNASLQGLNNIARGAKRNPWKFAGRIVATNFLLGALIPIINEVLTGGDDDDDKNSYYNLPEYIRRSNICFRFSKDMPWITIPLPIEFRAIYGLGELATGMLTGKERYSDEEFAKQFVSQLSQVLPLDFMEGGGGWHAFVPSQLKPFVEAQGNKSWTGLPIYKDTPFNQNDPEWTKAYKSANKQLVEATKWLNDLTNGSDYAADEKKGWIDINPAKIEYMLKGYFGGYTTMLDRFVKTAETVFGDRDFEWRNIPMASRVLREGDERTANRKLTNEYYDLLDEYNETKSIEKKKREKAESGDYVAKADYVAYTNFNENYKKAQVIDNFKPLLDALKDEKKNQSEYSLVEIEERENELRREMVDLIHSIQDAKKGHMPDIETPVDHMLDREFDRHGYTSKAAASRIASRMGGTDGYGSGNALETEYGKVYYNLRDHYDLRQDVAMQVAIKQAKDAGDDDRARDLDLARDSYNKNKKAFENGAKEAEQGLQLLRRDREQALEEHKVPFDKRPEK